MRERQRAEIVRNLLAERGFLSIADIMAATGVSAASARRDAGRLAESGLPSACTAASRRSTAPSRKPWRRRRSPRAPSTSTRTINIAAKRAIARSAVEMCADGDVVIINGGTTTYQMSEFLRARAAEDPDQLLSARGIPDPRDPEPRRAARRRGLSRPEADRRAVRRRRDPALFGAAHVHERDLDRPARPDRGRSADRARRDEAPQARRPARRARRFLEIRSARQPGRLPASAHPHADHRLGARRPRRLRMLADAGVRTVVVEPDRKPTEAA